MNSVFQNKWLRRLVMWVLAPVALFYAWFQWNYPTCTFRYKLTAEVMTPEGLKTGSSVIEVTYAQPHKILPDGPSIVVQAKGEAIFIKLTDKMYFVVSLSGVDPVRKGRGRVDWESQYLEGALNIHQLPIKVLEFPSKPLPAFKHEFTTVDYLNQHIAEKKKQNLVLPIRPVHLPALLVFKDINDPDSVTYVQPNDLAGVAGSGFELKQVTFQLTEETPTQNGFDWIPWWDAKVEEQRTLGSFGQGQSLINNILDSAFRRPGIWDNNK